MDLNDGKYIQNGGCGYVLKPAIMREPITYFSANTRDIIPGVSPQILHVKVSTHDDTPEVSLQLLHFSALVFNFKILLMLRSCSEMLPVFVADNQRAAAAQAARVRREGRHDRPVRDGGDLRDPGRLRRGVHQDHPTQRWEAPH